MAFSFFFRLYLTDHGGLYLRLWHARVHASERGRLLHLLMICHRPRPAQISCGVLVGDVMMVDLCYAVINKQWAAVFGTIMTV